MNREGFLATLTILSVLLIEQLSKFGSEFGLTKPLWIGGLRWSLFSTSYHLFILSTYGATATSVFAVIYGTKAHIISPSALTGFGLFAFLLETSVESVAMWFNYEFVQMDEKLVEYGHIPTAYRSAYYVSYAVPHYLAILSIVPYTLHIRRDHIAQRQKLCASGSAQCLADVDGGPAFEVELGEPRPNARPSRFGNLYMPLARSEGGRLNESPR